MGLFGRRPDRRTEPGGPAVQGPADQGPWTAPDSTAEIPEQLGELTLTTLNHALDSIEAGGPLIPLVLVESDDGRHLHRFVAELLEEGLGKAQQFVGNDRSWRRAALAYDGYMAMEGDRRDAIYVLGWDRELRTAISVAHRYVPGGPDGPLTRLEGPLYLGVAPPPGG